MKLTKLLERLDYKVVAGSDNIEEVMLQILKVKSKNGQENLQ